jgi:hypothetical protein
MSDTSSIRWVDTFKHTVSGLIDEIPNLGKHIGVITERIKNIIHNGDINPSAIISIIMDWPITFFITFAIQIVIVWAILFRMNIGNMQKNYMEISVILLTLFIVSKLTIFAVGRNLDEDGKFKKLLVEYSISVPPKSDQSTGTVGFILLLETLAIGLGSLLLLSVLTVFILMLKYFTNDNIIGFTWYIFLFIFVLLALFIIGAVIYKYTTSEDQKKTHIRLFIETLFGYIPCLILDIIAWFKNEVSMVSKLGIIISLIIGVYFGFYYLNKFLVRAVDDKYILTGPVYINKKTILEVKPDKSDVITAEVSGDKNKSPKYNYSTSFWFWITPQPPGTNKSYSEYTNIFTYGDRPSVEYNPKIDTLRVSCRISPNSIEDIYTTKSIPKQTWNQFVMNYNGGTMDIFLNGELVSSAPNVVPYMKKAGMTIGKDKGLVGGIRDVDHSYKLFNSYGVKMIYYIKKIMFQFEQNVGGKAWRDMGQK